jgi:hypothetical protein
VELCAQDQDQGEEQYEGPSILTRDPTLAGERGGKLVDFQLYGELTGIYDSGLTPVAVNSSGQLNTSSDDYGGQVGFGAMGSHTWEFDEVKLDYHGDYRRYTPNNEFGGTDQMLQFDWNHVVSKHVRLDVHEVGGIQTLSYGPLAYVPLRNTDLIGVPTNLLFDQKTYFTQSGVDLVWQKTARLSFGLGGDGFLSRYQAASLAGVSGYRARGDIAYRITKQQTVYASYAYQEFDYQRAFGNANMQMGQLGWSLGIGRLWELSAEGGAAEVRSLGLEQVPIDPAIAAIVGPGYTTVTSQRNTLIPIGQATITRRFHRSAVNATGGITVSPGNGVYLTSRQTTATLNYSYAGGRRLTASLGGGYSRLQTLSQQQLSDYGGFAGGAGLGYKLFSNASFQCRYDLYRYAVQNVSSKDENRVTVGFAISSGERPLAIW